MLTDEDAAEISLAENEMRQAMHPADQFEAFKALIDAGHGTEDVAARFGVTPTVVRQRLKLAAVSPKLMALYREGANVARPADGLHRVGRSRGAGSGMVRCARVAAQRPCDPADAHRRACAGDDRRARFVTVAAYVEAGGGVITDLFRTESEGYLTDPALLDRLVNEKLEREAEAVRQEGWTWVRDHARLRRARCAHDSER